MSTTQNIKKKLKKWKTTICSVPAMKFQPQVSSAKGAVLTCPTPIQRMTSSVSSLNKDIITLTIHKRKTI